MLRILCISISDVYRHAEDHCKYTDNSYMYNSIGIVMKVCCSSPGQSRTVGVMRNTVADARGFPYHLALT